MATTTITYQRLEDYINNQKRAGMMNETAREILKIKLDVFLLANRISESQYSVLMKLME